MKKILLAVFVLFIWGISKAQYPIPQGLGGTNAMVTARGGLTAAQTFVIPVFADTTSANINLYTKFYTGSCIFTTQDSSYWVRNKTTFNNYWFKIGGASGGPTGSNWQVGGNSFIFVPAGGPRIGTTAVGGGNFIIMTNSVDRLTFLETGISVMSAGTDSVLVKNTSGHVGVVAKGSLSSTPTWQQTLTAGSTLTGDNTVAGGGFDFTWNNIGEFFTIQQNFNSIVSQLYMNQDVELASTSATGSSAVTISAAGININPSLGNLKADTLLNLTTQDKLMGWTSTTGGDRGEIGYLNIGGGLSLSSGTLSSSTVATTVPISGLTAATGTNTIDNADLRQVWNWNTLSGVNGLRLESTSTAAASNEQTLLYINTTGVNVNAAETTYGVQIINNHSGTLSNNVGAKINVSSGTSSNVGMQIISSGTGLQLGSAGSSKGTMTFGGNTSGTVTVQPAAAAGTWSMTLPTNDGDADQVLVTNGSGVTSWSTPAASGANTALSNLASVAINTSLLPGTDNAIDLGSTTKGWRKNYLSSAGVIDFGNGLQTITHSGASKLTIQTSGADDSLYILTTGSNRAVLMVSAPSFAAEMGTIASGTSVKLVSFSGSSGMEFSGTGYFLNGSNQINFSTTSSIFNSNSNDVDFQVKSDGDDNALYVDASANKIGIKTGTPLLDLDLRGEMLIADASAPITGSVGSANLSIIGNVASLNILRRGTSSLTSATAGDRWAFYADGGNFHFYTGTTGNVNTIESDGDWKYDFKLGVGVSPTARIHIAAGTATASTAPLKFTSGTSNTVAEAGTIEYTTPQLFFTNGAAVRQELFQGQQARVSTQYDNTTTTLGTVTGLTTNVAAGKTYRFETVLYTTSNIGGGIKAAIAGTATATNIIYESETWSAGIPVSTGTTRASALATTVGDITAVTVVKLRITGTITVNDAGTLLVQAAANTAVGTTSVLVGSIFTITEML